MGMACGKRIKVDTVTNMRENSRVIKNKVMAFTVGKQDIFTKATTAIIFAMAMGRCTGTTIPSIRGSGKTTCSMAKENFLQEKNI